MQSGTAGKSTRFFRNYNRLVGGTYVAIVLLTGLFFLHQLRQQHEAEVEAIRGHVGRHAQLVEFILRSSLDALESMRVSATESYRAVGKDPRAAAAAAPLFSMLRATPEGFDLDAVRERDASGNVVGTGSLQGRTPEFYADLSVALRLAPVFQSFAFNLPHAAQAGFISREQFGHTYPWIERGKRPFTANVYASPVWSLGTPDRNPNRERYWASVHYEGVENGLLVPAAAPVYAEGKFRGVVFIDISLDYLNRLVADFSYPHGKVFLVDANGQVLAHPDFFADPLSVRSTRPMADALPRGLDSAKLMAVPPGEPREVAGHVVIRHAFQAAPWQLIYVQPSRDVWATLLRANGTAMLLVFIGLTLLMVVTYYVTTREFISPASHLVAHIAAESRLEPQAIPKVPAAWRPWFETISHAFRESLQLAGIRQELDIAASLQQAILPRHWPNQKEFALWGTMRSAKEVGGDFYDHFPLEKGRFGLVVADVSGKGVPAALFGMVSKTLLHATATRFGLGLGEAMATVNNMLCEDNDGCIFVTVFYAVFDGRDGTLTYVNAGHPPPLLTHDDGRSEELAMTDGTALGIMEGLRYEQKTIQMNPGDTLLVFSDGVTEAMNGEGELFTAQRLAPLFARSRQQDVRATVNTVIAAVDAHAAGAPQSDDITCMALRCHVHAHATVVLQLKEIHEA